MYKNLIIAALAFLVVASSAAAADFAKIDKLVQPLLDQGEIVGCVVGVVENGIKEVRGYGSTRTDRMERPTADTVYEIGSITKTFTGTLLADMVLRGEVKLDDPLQDFMPVGVKLHLSKDQPIRLVDLASQSSGLPRLPDNFAAKDLANPYADYTTERMFEFLGRYKLGRPPGEYEYSNLGMGVLGTVLSRKASLPYERLVVERICKPLEMNDTRIKLSDEQRKRLAQPYDCDLVAAKNWDFDALAGCGAMRSTTNDLLKLVSASLANDDRPVVRAIHETWKPHFEKPKQTSVGLAWHMVGKGNVKFHNGLTGGYTGAVWIHSPKKTGVVVLCNTATTLTSTLGDKCLQSLVGKDPKPIVLRPEAKVDPAVLKTYRGTYMLSLFFAITITVEDGKLMAQATNQTKSRIYGESETKCFYKNVDAKISFEKDDKGNVNRLVLHQFGKDMLGMKLPEVKAQN